ncbi:hypothetical protein Syun_004118 [Stephania yunnanensis]|uniref:Uncharacterized protein n=1 Tax=Stephania yunnanensis TaxID=152371 RepID=A0AAP0L2Q0_9MAGN
MKVQTAICNFNVRTSSSMPVNCFASILKFFAFISISWIASLVNCSKNCYRSSSCSLVFAPKNCFAVLLQFPAPQGRPEVSSLCALLA